jgi:hypothetical protein
MSGTTAITSLLASDVETAVSSGSKPVKLPYRFLMVAMQP